jgi:hypothetical protein
MRWTYLGLFGIVPIVLLTSCYVPPSYVQKRIPKTFASSLTQGFAFTSSSFLAGPYGGGAWLNSAFHLPDSVRD